MKEEEKKHGKAFSVFLLSRNPIPLLIKDNLLRNAGTAYSVSVSNTGNKKAAPLCGVASVNKTMDKHT